MWNQWAINELHTPYWRHSTCLQHSPRLTSPSLQYKGLKFRNDPYSRTIPPVTSSLLIKAARCWYLGDSFVYFFHISPRRTPKDTSTGENLHVQFAYTGTRLQQSLTCDRAKKKKHPAIHACTHMHSYWEAIRWSLTFIGRCITFAP